MPLQNKVGSFNTGTGTTPIVLTGFGFQPKLMFFWYNGRVETVNTAGNASHRRGWGFSLGAGNNGSVGTKSQTGVTANTATDQHELRSIEILNASTDTVDGSANVSSFDSDGATIAIPESFGQNFTIHYWALGGTDIDQVGYATLTEPAVAGNVDVTSLGFAPDALIIMANPTGALTGGVAVDSRCMLGFASFSPTIKQAVLACGSDDGAVNTNTASFCRMGEVVAHIASDFSGLNSHGSITAQLSNGFRINFSEVVGSGNREHQCIAIKGGSWFVDSFLTVAAANPINISGLPFTPNGAMFMSHAKAESAADTLSSIDECVVGFVDSAGAQRSMAVEDSDNQVTSVVNTVVQFDSVYAASNGAGGVDSVIQQTSFGANSMALSQVSSDGTGKIVPFLAMGNNGQPMHRRRMGVWPGAGL